MNATDAVYKSLFVFHFHQCLVYMYMAYSLLPLFYPSMFLYNVWIHLPTSNKQEISLSFGSSLWIQV